MLTADRVVVLAQGARAHTIARFQVSPRKRLLVRANSVRTERLRVRPLSRRSLGKIDRILERVTEGS